MTDQPITLSPAAAARIRALSDAEGKALMLRVAVDEPAFARCRSLRRLYCGGEALTPDLIERVRATLELEVVNLYGPTEVCIDSVTLRIEGTRITGNRSNGEGGSGIFFVSNDRSGDVFLEDSVLRNNTGDGFETYPGVFFLGDGFTTTNTVIE